jgi:hypothetical protein
MATAKRVSRNGPGNGEGGTTETQRHREKAEEQIANIRDQISDQRLSNSNSRFEI